MATFISSGPLLECGNHRPSQANLPSGPLLSVALFVSDLSIARAFLIAGMRSSIIPFDCTSLGATAAALLSSVGLVGVGLVGQTIRLHEVGSYRPRGPVHLCLGMQVCACTDEAR